MHNIKSHNLRIWFVGAHGTGKSTLLKEMIHPNKIQEIARSVIEKGKHPNDMNLFERYQFQKLLLSKQIAEEYKFWNKWFVSDRTIYDIIAYTISLFSDDLITTWEGSMLHDAIEYLTDRYIRRNIDRYDILFYTPIEFPLEKDGIRFEDEKYQEEIDKIIRELLDRYEIKYFTLRWTVKERINKIDDIINLFI